ncbi:related to transcription factor TFIIIC subunit [Melanopsichium pennsylvanicum]|uniref:Related to transcription factor TFIIIC subunit n=2 Tax=Melanopsichium pennsylvanicum TaxID=63383 RepID=A0AAJ5C2M1_9BASI|nr:related to transcription factor TFIIIC subunit [Melanopsichium pennsylvanicum 4]SNX81647.1 related to transcription factor TFIIIC subunit [Melanopsichium pennsylvanicum]
MDAEAGPSRTPARRSARKAALTKNDNTFDWSQIARIGLDGDSDDGEFGALAFDDFDDVDSINSKPDWDDENDSDAAQAKPSRTASKKMSNKTPRHTRGLGPSSSTVSQRQSAAASDESQYEDEDYSESSAADDIDLGGLDPAVFGEEGRAQQQNSQGDVNEADNFEPEAFERLVTSLQDTSREAGALRQLWDTSIEAENAEFENELRAAAGFRQKRKVRRRAHEQPLSSEVQALLADANLAYVENRLRDAIPKLEEVIRIEPNVKAAWNTLGLIYSELGEEEKSIQCRIIGAHLQSGASHEWKSLAYRSITQMLYRQAIYCFQQAIKIDKTDVDSIWDRALLLRDLGDYKAAINGMLDILKLQPYDASVVRELVPMLVTTRDYDRGVEVLERWRKSSMEAFPNPTVNGVLDPALTGATATERTAQASSTAPTINNFQISEVVTLADLLLLTRKPLETIQVLRQTARWLDGRANEDFWDAVNDDREFDGDIDPMIRKERDQEGYGRQVETAEPHTLDPEVRLRLGKARMMLGDVAEAKQHFDILTESDPGDASQIFAEIGDCYYEHKLWAEALDVLTDLAATDYATDDVSLYAKLAGCNHALGELEEAARLYEPVVEASPDTLEWQLRLAEVYEGLGEKEKSLEVLQQVMRILQAQQTAEARSDTGQGLSAWAEGATARDPQLSFFDEMRTAGPAKTASSAKRAKLDYNRQQRLKLEFQREQETQLAWRRMELLDPHVFIEGFWRYDVAVTKESEEAFGHFYSSSESPQDRDKRYRQTQQWLEEAGSLIDAFRLNPRLNGLHLKRRRPGGSKSIRANARERRGASAFPGTLASMLHSRTSGSNAISTQARNLLHRLQDQLVEDDAAPDLADGSGGGDCDSFRPRAEPGPKQLDMARFRGVSIEEWIGLFAKYSFLLVKSGEPVSVVNSLFHSLHTSAVVWGIFERMLVVQLAWLSCALYARDWPTVWSGVRWLAQDLQFHNLPLKLGASIANGTGLHSLGRLIANNDLKYYQRRMRQAEAVARGAPCKFSTQNKKWIVAGAATSSLTEQSGKENGGAEAGSRNLVEEARRRAAADGDEEEASVLPSDTDGESDDSHIGYRRDSHAARQDSAGMRDIKGDRPDEALAVRLARPSKPSPLAEMFYGYMLLYSGGFQPSAAFFGRAYAIQPTDPLLCLVTAVAFLSRATNRQTDNRHHMVLTGMAFFQKYLKFRQDEKEGEKEADQHGKHLAEMEYNRGRMMHHVGLVHLAEKHYRAVLEYSARGHDDADGDGDDDDDDGWGMKREAAWNLSLIYATAGSPHLAEDLYDRYLRV